MDQFEAFLDVGVFAAAKDDRKDDLIFLSEKIAGFIDFKIEIVLTNLRSQADLFVLALVSVTFVLPFLLLILVLSIVHDLADWWILRGSYLHQVQVGIAGLCQCILGGDNS